VAVATEKKPKGKASDKGKKDGMGKVNKAGKESASKQGKLLKAPKKKPAGRRERSPKAQKKNAGKRTTGKKQPKCNPDKKGKIADSVVVAQSEADAAVMRALDPFEVAKQTMKGSVPAIVEAMVELAKQGSCSHAKTLLEITGARHMFDSEVERQDSGEPWAKLVLKRLDEAESEEEQESARLQEELPEVVAAP
jgi:hypothetical protein